jgi:peptide/nickel transport system permease protein
VGDTPDPAHGDASGSLYVALIARITRTTMLDVLAEDYIRTAGRSAGRRDAPDAAQTRAKNAGVLIVTVIGIGVALLIGGVVITETVFNIPGVGRLVVDAFQARLPAHPGRNPGLLASTCW